MCDEEHDAIVIGAGPAGLMAADALASRGFPPVVLEAMPSPARKFLMAGKSGLNLTKQEETAKFLAAYGNVPPHFLQMIDDFGAERVSEFAKNLGQELFVGSTGRVFPKQMKASPLLRSWLNRLDSKGAELRRRSRWLGWHKGALVLDTHGTKYRIQPKVCVFALGGGSWAKLGSNGDWVSIFEQRGISLAPLKPSNSGVSIAWSEYMDRHFGTPLKSIRASAGQLQSRAEMIITKTGLEGGGIYELTPEIRDGSRLFLDLKPDVGLDELKNRLARSPRKASQNTVLRKQAGLSEAAIAVLQEFSRPLPRGPELAERIKHIEVEVSGLRPIDEAISTAGGVDWVALDDRLMLKKLPGAFVAGEMLNWEAPTGGYLLTACFATGYFAGQAAADQLEQ